ncbi:MAG: hypothetical protein KDJ75_04555 [Alphaproteobacteria bacterium]|nr:hypothetical protein [Alphaproteobacteria bacterium]
MVSNPLNAPRVEIYADKKKILIYNGLAFIVSYIAWLIACAFAPEFKNFFTAGLFVLGGIVILGTHKTWPFLRHQGGIKIYDNGIALDGLGFWEWDELMAASLGENAMSFTLPVTGRTLPKKKGKLPATVYRHELDNGGLTIGYEFPSFVTNISGKTFCEVFYKALSSKKEAEQQGRPERWSVPMQKTWRTMFWGTEKSAPLTQILIVPCSVVMGLTAYGLFSSGFFPSPEWMAVSLKTALGLSAFASMFYYAAYAKGKVKLNARVRHLKRRFVVLAFLPVLCFIFLYPALSLGAGHIAVLLWGQGGAETILPMRVEQTKRGLHLRRDDNAIVSGVINASRKDFNRYDSFTIQAYGKESWFGFVVDHYKVLDDAP